MPTFLEGTNRGWVKQLTSPAGAAGAVVSGVNIANCLFTQITVAAQANVQFMHTLGNHIFVYTFGDRIGEMSLGGLAYFDCDATGSHGIGNAMRFYDQHNIVASGSKMSVTVGGLNLRGYLLGFRAAVQNVEQALLEFQLSFALIPR